MAESAPSPAGRRAPPGAAPPLAYQIAAAESIVLCTTAIAGGKVSYRVREVWKAPASASSFKTGEPLQLDTRVHELLGFRPANGQQVIVFFIAEGLPRLAPLEVLPVLDGATTYSPHDGSVREKIALEQLKERVASARTALPEILPQAGVEIPLRISFIGLKSVPVVALAHNNLAPLLVLFDDHLVQRVIFKTPRKYSEIEYVEVSSTDTDNLDIAYTGSWFTFGSKLREKQDLIKALRFFGRKGVRLGERAGRLLSEADLRR